MELHVNKLLFGASSKVITVELTEVKLTTFLRHQKVVSLDILNMLIIEINCALYSNFGNEIKSN